ncbi:MAG: hypothetical protein AAF934_01395 [Bacteroidota bacterium]
MTKPITIPKTLPQNTALSYDFLREEGIQHIQQMAGDTWTDHNIHDPGITILEQLCYAITDLAYRMDYDMKDLLGRDDASSYGDLYGPAAILTVNPVTLLDLRKVIIDVEGVKNAWVEKVSQNNVEATADDENPAAITPRGLYRVLIEKDGLVQAGTELLSKVKARIHACRGVCEDFEEFRLLDPQYIRLRGTIEIADKVDDINQLVADILYKVSWHLSPRISFYTLKQLLEKGKRIDEIFEGPALNHGFIDDDELLRHTRKREIHTSDVICEIMDVEGVLAVDEFSIATGTDTVKEWLLSLDPAKTPKLDVRNMKEALKTLEFTAQGLKASVNPDRVKALYDQKSKASLSKRVLRPEARDIFLPESRDRKLSSYYSIQHQFPANYGIGSTGLPDTVPEKRKAQAKQLTAYLALFEQLLANYFSQLAHFKDLVSFDGEKRSTYFNQSLLDTVSGLEDVLVSTENYLKYLEERTSDSEAELKRKNQFLDHLLARFGEKFTGYGMLLDNVTHNDNGADGNTDSDYGVAKKLITDKSNFLRDYPIVSVGRARAYDYTQAYWQNDNSSGLEKRIARKLGVEDYSRRNLGDGDTEGFHMIEHVLLRPHAKDTYPFRSHYIPGNITAFEDPENTGFTRCVSPDHTLKEGEQIRIQGPGHYEGVHTVHTIGGDHFEIEVGFQDTANEGTWQRTQPDIRYVILTEPVTAFSAGSQGGHSFCEVGEHNLQEGDRIEIAGTQHYDDVYTITGVTDDGFEIDKTFVENEDTGRWMQVDVPTDPYSFQLTFVLPEWMERYQNDQLKRFVENTIREETPAHLTVYMRWLSKPEMQHFDQAFYRFLFEINKR